MDNLYTTALLSYTFTLAGDKTIRSELITYLHQRAYTQGRTVKYLCLAFYLFLTIYILHICLFIYFN